MYVLFLFIKIVIYSIYINNIQVAQISAGNLRNPGKVFKIGRTTGVTFGRFSNIDARLEIKMPGSSENQAPPPPKTVNGVLFRGSIPNNRGTFRWWWLEGVGDGGKWGTPRNDLEKKWCGGVLCDPNCGDTQRHRGDPTIQCRLTLRVSLLSFSLSFSPLLLSFIVRFPLFSSLFFVNVACILLTPFSSWSLRVLSLWKNKIKKNAFSKRHRYMESWQIQDS